jgi:hypothetical protein
METILPLKPFFFELSLNKPFNCGLDIFVLLFMLGKPAFIKLGKRIFNFIIICDLAAPHVTNCFQIERFHTSIHPSFFGLHFDYPLDYTSVVGMFGAFR